jgi:hypothetical protein
MPRRRSNLGRRTRGAEAVRRVVANQTEEERASANERNRQIFHYRLNIYTYSYHHSGQNQQMLGAVLSLLIRSRPPKTT